MNALPQDFGAPRPAPAAAPMAPAFAFDADDFARVRELIHRRAGISLGDGKQALVYSRLARRLRDTGQTSFAGYLRWLDAASGDAAAAEWQRFVNALTTNLTSFFRERHHFEALAAELARRDAPLGVWCAAASTGEEPYSIAMTCAEAGRGEVDIVASDIDTEVLAVAVRGIYPASAGGLSPERLRRHFLRGSGANAGFVRVQPALAARVGFRRFNLAGERPFGGAGFDIVFCRNVMIYFDAPTQRRVLARLHAAMRPGGVLFVGHSESFADVKSLFRLRGKTTYERV